MSQIMTQLEISTETEDEDLLEPVNGREIGIDLGTCNSVVSYIKEGIIGTLKVRNKEIIPSAIFFKNPNELYYGSIALRKGFQNPESIAKLFKRKLKNRQDKIKIEFQDKTLDSKVYIIDTNIFIDEPQILKRFQDHDKIVVSTKVIDELSHRANQLETKFQATVAVKTIKEYEKKLIFETSDSSLLPEDLDRRLPDNLILSIAFKMREQNPIILTSDKEFQLKCKTNDIKYNSLKTFLSSYPSNSENSIEISGEEASALFLKYLKNEASKSIGPVSKAVITVPANFNSVEIESTKRAALTADFEEVIIFQEPTAAAIAYGFEVKQDKNILIYDFGGGTFDVSIIKAQADKSFNVINTGGNSNLGGEDLTQELVHFIYDELEEEYGINMYSHEESQLTLNHYRHNVVNIHDEAELAKIQLSDFQEKNIDFTILYITDEIKKPFSITISRNKFEEIVRDKISSTFKTLDKTIKGANLYAEDIDVIVLAGGTSLMPIIQERVKKYFGKSPNYEKNTATVIAQGAAIKASSEFDDGKNGIQEKIKLFEKTTSDFGVEVEGHRFHCLIPAGSDLPVSQENDYSPVKDGQKDLRISVYRRNKDYPELYRTFDEHIDFIDKISISNLPPMGFNDTIKVFFELSKEDILTVNVKIIDFNGNVIESGNTLINKASRITQ
ncbi:MAG: Hsp70 family protein [Desulfamplus sp.]|nr:Hsp70 family protein [Desulfamplus sp.]